MRADCLRRSKATAATLQQRQHENKRNGLIASTARPPSEIKQETELIFYLISNSLCPGVNICSFTKSNSALTHGQPEVRPPLIYQLHKRHLEFWVCVPCPRWAWCLSFQNKASNSKSRSSPLWSFQGYTPRRLLLPHQRHVPSVGENPRRMAFMLFLGTMQGTWKKAPLMCLTWRILSSSLWPKGVLSPRSIPDIKSSGRHIARHS